MLNLKPDDKHWLGTLLRDEIHTVKELHTKYGNPQKTLYKYKNRVASGGVLSESGRLIDKKYHSEIIDYLKEGHFNKTTPEYKLKLSDLCIQTAENRGLGPSSVNKMSYRSNMLKLVQLQEGTHALQFATSFQWLQ